jgi:hypothetical protein
MNPERIRERIPNGFRPFVILTSAGKRSEVPDPESLAVVKGVVVVQGSSE